MSKTITIKLLDPIDGGLDGPITEIVLREPRAREYLDFGDIYQHGRGGDTIYSVENEGVFQKYFQTLMVTPKYSPVMMNISLADTMQVKDWIVGFFTSSRARTHARASQSIAD